MKAEGFETGFKRCSGAMLLVKEIGVPGAL